MDFLLIFSCFLSFGLYFLPCVPVRPVFTCRHTICLAEHAAEGCDTIKARLHRHDINLVVGFDKQLARVCYSHNIDVVIERAMHSIVDIAAKICSVGIQFGSKIGKTEVGIEIIMLVLHLLLESFGEVILGLHRLFGGFLFYKFYNLLAIAEKVQCRPYSTTQKVVYHSHNARGKETCYYP